MKLIVRFTFFFVLSIIFIPSISHAASVAERTSGRILLQVQDKGEAWYVYPNDLRRYYLGRPFDAWNVMRSLGLGITNANLAKIPTKDDAWDGDSAFINSLKGKILLQVENNGEAWYVNPPNGKRYYLGRPDDAFGVMRFLGLGATTNDIFSINPNIQIATIHYRGSGSAQADEYVEIVNRGSLAQTFNTWTLMDEAKHTFTFPNNYTLQPGASVRVYTNMGELSFNNKAPIWNNDGDTAYLRGANGALVDVYRY
jgi:hypothetical protein